MDEHLGYPMSPESYALVRSFWESAGLPLDELLSSRDATLQLLDAPNRLAQIVAMSICIHHWRCKDNVRFRNKCLALAKDSSDDVRTSACGVLGHCFSATRNRCVQTLLAEIACDLKNPLFLRKVASSSFRQIEHGFSVNLVFDLLADEKDDVVGLEQIRRFLSESAGGMP